MLNWVLENTPEKISTFKLPSAKVPLGKFPTRKFPPGIFSPISLIVFFILSSHNGIKGRGRVGESVHILLPILPRWKNLICPGRLKVHTWEKIVIISYAQRQISIMKHTICKYRLLLEYEITSYELRANQPTVTCVPLRANELAGYQVDSSLWHCKLT